MIIIIITVFYIRLLFLSLGITKSFTLNPNRVEYREMREMLQNLDEYITELLEWTDTAFATIYPHDDMVLIHEWGR